MIAVADVLHLPLADQSVDLVICSPPYEDCRTYATAEPLLSRPMPPCKLRGQEWVDWATAGFCECLRVCRGLVAWVIGHGRRRNFRWSATPSLFEADLHRRGVILRDPVWFHRVGIPGSGGPDWFRQDMERIVCATAHVGRLPWSDNVACGHAPKYGLGGEMSYRNTSGKRCNQWGPVGGPRGMGSRRANGTIRSRERPSHIMQSKNEFGVRTDVPIGTRPEGNKDAEREDYRAGFREDKEGNICATANPGSMLHCNVGGGVMGHPLSHKNEAPFPLQVPELFIRSFCPPGGLVLDPFSGSGTTAHAAVKWGRRFVTFDRRPSQCQITRQRVAEVQMELIA